MRQLTLDLFAPAANVAPGPNVPAAPPPSSAAPPAQEVQNLHPVPVAPAVPVLTPLGLMIASVGAIVGAYHGTRRNRGSVGWGLVWGLAGATAPLITTGIAVAQGYGSPRESR